MVLVFVVTLVWSILDFLDKVTAEKSEDLKAIVTERWQIPSQMPFAYADSLATGPRGTRDDIHPARLDDLAVLRRHDRPGQKDDPGEHRSSPSPWSPKRSAR